jgi:hypothetical protein
MINLYYFLYRKYVFFLPDGKVKTPYYGIFILLNYMFVITTGC